MTFQNENVPSADAIGDRVTAPLAANDEGNFLSMEMVKEIRDTIKAGDGWDGDQFDFALANAIAAHVLRIERAQQAPKMPSGKPVAWYRIGKIRTETGYEYEGKIFEANPHVVAWKQYEWKPLADAAPVEQDQADKDRQGGKEAVALLSDAVESSKAASTEHKGGDFVSVDALTSFGDKWLITDPLAHSALKQLIETQAEPIAVPEGGANAQPELTVWYGPMPESNGKSNFTAVLMRKGGSIFDCNEHTIARSEYPDRVRYEADRVRYLIGELKKRPSILDYDSDLHSDYVYPDEKVTSAKGFVSVNQWLLSLEDGERQHVNSMGKWELADRVWDEALAQPAADPTAAVVKSPASLDGDDAKTLYEAADMLENHGHNGTAEDLRDMALKAGS